MLNTFTNMRSWVFRGIKVIAVLLVTVLLLEVSFRYYFIDFYNPELLALNETLPHKSESRPTILFFGDSFTGNAKSYVDKLRDQLPYSLINSAVSGTGILETSFMAPSRLKKFKPTVVVYQIYLGNDLLDIRHRPTGKISLGRRIYHSISDQLRVLKFINYRLGKYKFQASHQRSEKRNNAFSTDHYSRRQKMLFNEEPRYLEHTLELVNSRDRDISTLVNGIREIENQLDKEVDLILLLVPHCAQVNTTYQTRMEMIGSKSKLESLLFYETIQREFPGLIIVDVLQEFQSIDSLGHRLYLGNDPHLSDIGQTAMANILKPYLDTEILSE